MLSLSLGPAVAALPCARSWRAAHLGRGAGWLAQAGHRVDQWSFLLDGSLGAGLRLYRRYYLTLAAHVQMAEPYVAIHFVDAVVATSGRPNLLLTLTVGAWL